MYSYLIDKLNVEICTHKCNKQPKADCNCAWQRLGDIVRKLVLEQIQAVQLTDADQLQLTRCLASAEISCVCAVNSAQLSSSVSSHLLHTCDASLNSNDS